MKIVFSGTPEFAVAPLRALVEGGFEIAAVLTQPDKPQGRKGTMTPPPVKIAAERFGLPVLQPESLKRDPSVLAAVGADLMVTCAYGQILTQETLDLFSAGVWNIHASLLPAYRGAAPVARAIIDGVKQTGVTIMKTDAGVDTGPIFLQRAVEISATDTAGSLGEKLSRLGAELIAEALCRIGRGDLALRPQGEGFVCKKVQRTEVDFNRPSGEVSALIRGLSPAPGSFATAGGQTLNFYAAEEVGCAEEAEPGTVLCARPRAGLVVRCGTGAVRLTEVQPLGGKRMPDVAFLNGRKLVEGMKFALSGSV